VTQAALDALLRHRRTRWTRSVCRFHERIQGRPKSVGSARPGARLGFDFAVPILSLVVSVPVLMVTKCRLMGHPEEVASTGQQAQNGISWPFGNETRPRSRSEILVFSKGKW
jgi:hypothetical protein